MSRLSGAPSRQRAEWEEDAMGRLKGKRAVVTGAGSGIGRASPKLFAAEGEALLIVDKTAAAVEDTAAHIGSAGAKVIALAADAGVEAEVRGFIDKVVRDLGGLDIVYANAGVSGGLVPLFEQTVEMLQEILRVNLIGPFFAIRNAAPHMIKQGQGA